MGGTLTSYIYDTSMEDPLAFDDITLEFEGTATPTLKRRWLHSNAVDEPVGFEAYTNSSGVGSGSEYAMFADRQGSVIWVTEPATGQVAAGYAYDGYGQITQTQGALNQPYGYTGREYDAESGLYHYRARAYDPAAGVFMQVDPIEFDGGTLNVSGYVSADTFNFVDPTGLESEEADRLLYVQAADGILEQSTVFKGIISGAAKMLQDMFNAVDEGFGQSRPVYTTKNGKKIICRPEVLTAITGMMNREPGKCSGAFSKANNLAIMQELQMAFIVRTAITEMCYGLGTDSGHPVQEDQLMKQMVDCRNKIAKKKGTGKPN